MDAPLTHPYHEKYLEGSRSASGQHQDKSQHDGSRGLRSASTKHHEAKKHRAGSRSAYGAHHDESEHDGTRGALPQPAAVYQAELKNKAIDQTRKRADEIYKRMGAMIVNEPGTAKERVSLVECLSSVIKFPESPPPCLYVCDNEEGVVKKECIELLTEYQTMWRDVRKDLTKEEYDNATRELHDPPRIAKKVALGVIAFLGTLAAGGAAGYMVRHQGAKKELAEQRHRGEHAVRQAAEAQKSAEAAEGVLRQFGMTPEELQAFKEGKTPPMIGKRHYWAKKLVQNYPSFMGGVASVSAALTLGSAPPTAAIAGALGTGLLLEPVIAAIRNASADRRAALQAPAKEYLAERLHREKYHRYNIGGFLTGYLQGRG